jgi:hypothetical protein
MSWVLTPISGVSKQFVWVIPLMTNTLTPRLSEDTGCRRNFTAMYMVTERGTVFGGFDETRNLIRLVD